MISCQFYKTDYNSAKKKSEKHKNFNTRNSGAHMLVKTKKIGKKERQ